MAHVCALQDSGLNPGSGDKVTFQVATHIATAKAAEKAAGPNSKYAGTALTRDTPPGSTLLDVTYSLPSAVSGMWYLQWSLRVTRQVCYVCSTFAADFGCCVDKCRHDHLHSSTSVCKTPKSVLQLQADQLYALATV